MPEMRRRLVLGLVDAMAIADDVLREYKARIDREGYQEPDFELKDRIVLASLVVGLSTGVPAGPQRPQGLDGMEPAVSPQLEKAIDGEVLKRCTEEFRTAAVRHGTDPRFVDRMLGLLSTVEEGRALVKVMAYRFHRDDGDQLV